MALQRPFVVGDEPGGVAVFVEQRGAPRAAARDYSSASADTDPRPAHARALDHVEHETELEQRFGIPVVTGPG